MLVVACLMSWTAPAQTYKPPVRHPMVLTGSFCELREDHFHAGVDLRSSGGKAGDPVISVAAGYVCRIIISHDGYGRAIHVRHPDGRTSVYAHLDRFNPALQAWVDTIRFAWHKEEIDLVLDKTQFPVRQGQLLGLMGTTGRSTGVHLHFELRERDGFHALDPARAGIRFPDNEPPVLTGLKVYGLDDKLLPLFDINVPLLKKGSVYKVKGDTLRIGAWRVGLGIAAHDPVAGNRFRTGIRILRVDVDRETVFEWRSDSLDLRLTRYNNAHWDHAEWIFKRRKVYRCYPLQGNRLPMFPVLKKAGVITLSQWEKREVTIAVTDQAGRSSQLRFWIRRDEKMDEPLPRLYQFRIPFGEDFSHEESDISWHIPAGALYETTYFEYARLESAAGLVEYKLHHPGLPLHKDMKVSLLLPEKARENPEIWVGAYKDGDRWMSCGGRYQDGYLSFRTRRLDTYRLYADTLAPVIRSITSAGHVRAGPWRFVLQDDVSDAHGGRNVFWDIHVDGQWVPGSWNHGDRILSFYPPSKANAGKRFLELRVRDERGNHVLLRDTL